MRNLKKYQGVLPAFYACYDDNGEISAARVRELVRYFIAKGVKGIYVNGSSGECIYQSVQDRKTVIEAVMAEAKGKLTVINHVACNNTKDSMELAAHSQALEVDAIAAIPPIYFKLPEAAIATYWNSISSAAPDTDFIIYNIPQLAGVALTNNLYAVMRKNPRVIGVKNSSMAVQDIQMFNLAGGENYIVFNGPDEQYLGGRVMGAKAGIGGTYAVMPELFLQLEKCIEEQNLTTAAKIQYAINDIIYKMVSGKSNMYAVAKEILRINAGINIGSVREPLTALLPEEKYIAEEAAEMINCAVTKYVKEN
ncbi:dihydrodipicolinate synthase family protein [Amygdalobacter indicium]|uniref:Dihydrodipicolinate synthase family protein n=1 Tax=Amygdalobacter indicium TaxID=3029272 RepID=A0ABY8C6Y1_9FIRM|nr:dihydrodipicolinate synthase family protein [Amygdalobacter indicium]WEG35207.1 dihydrodipicolinate synthase family protein [Amygdalobacter indicium]